MAIASLRRLLAFVAVFAVLSSGSPVFAAEFLAHYKAGLAAVQNEDWETARDRMGRAIEIQPKSKVRIKKALYFKHYLPHHYLGMALFNLGDCVGALVAWQESTAQGVIARLPEYEQLAAGRQVCLQHRSELESSLVEAESLIAAASVAALRAQRDMEEVQGREIAELETLSDRFQTARTLLEQAEGLLAQADGSLEKLQRSAAAAAGAQDGFEFVSIELAKRLQAAAAEQVETRATLNQLVVAGVRALEASEYLEPYPPGIADHRQRLEALVTRVGDLEVTAGNEQLVGLARQLRQTVAALERATTAPPTELTAAAEAFLGGRYRQVLELLADTEFDSSQATAQAHLLQAASLFALSRSQEGMDPKLLERARREVLSSLSLDEAVPIPSPRVFSPRFIEFFEAQRPWFLRT